MNTFEQLSIALRHHPRLSEAHWLWNRVRPLYDAVLARQAPHGLVRVMNGTDPIRILPSQRGVSEVYELPVWQHLMKQVRPGDVVADVGAFIGLYSIALAKRVCPAGKVFAFEPDPYNYKTLQAHVTLNRVEKWVQLEQIVAGTQDGTVWFVAERGSESRVRHEAETAGQPTPCIRLDTFFENTRLDILKIDVEGYEEQVLKGAQSLLSSAARRPRLIYIEVHPYAWHAVGTTSESLLEYLKICGFQAQNLDGQAVDKITTYGEVVATPI